MPKPSDVTIAPMDTDDLPAVLAIETAAFPSPWTERMFLESIRSEHGMGWVARASDRIVGYIVFAVCADECDLLNIAVAPASRRRGIARSLMLAMIAEAKCRGARVVYLDVRASNAAAQALYGAFGFCPVGRRRRYYRHEGEDALVMALGLSD